MSVTVTALSCSQCPNGLYRTESAVADVAVCDVCEHTVSVSADIRPHLDANETTTSTVLRRNGVLAQRLAVMRTDACECCGSISDAHFAVRYDGYLSTCPNDEN